MKICPECNNPIRRVVMKCPYCGYKFSVIETAFASLGYLILALIIIAVLIVLLVNVWDFSWS